MELTVQNVYGLLLRSKLLSIDQAKGLYTRWQTEARDGATNLSRFASWMVQNRYLTEYQATLLARGHADNFFLNEYKILDRLGKGRMAGVYLAQHQLGQTVAIKVLPPSKAKDPNLLGRFMREARLAVRLKHPNIVRTFQMGQFNDLYYLVMEYLEGDTLEELLAKRPKFLPAEAVRLVHQALMGLQHIHAQGLVHRDIKPANIMLVGLNGPDTTRSTLKILDIGLGRQLFDEGRPAQVEDGLTGEGVLLGTPDYMAPEQARDPRLADVRADIYSLGCVLYQMLAGQPPFPDTNMINQMIRHATEIARPLKTFNSAVPDGLQQIINYMMAKDPKSRYPTPERAAQALQVFLAAAQENLATPEADPKMRPYLNWVEKENSKREKPSGAAQAVAQVARPAVSEATIPMPAAPAASAAALAAAKAAIAPHEPAVGKPPVLPPIIPKVVSKAKRPASQHGERTHKKHSKKRSRSRSSSPPAASPAAGIDVELVAIAPLVAPPAAVAPRPSLAPNRRDFFNFAVGAMSGAVVTAVGCLLAYWVSRFRAGRQQKQDDSDKQKE